MNVSDKQLVQRVAAVLASSIVHAGRSTGTDRVLVDAGAILAFIEGRRTGR